MSRDDTRQVEPGRQDGFSVGRDGLGAPLEDRRILFLEERLGDAPEMVEGGVGLAHLVAPTRTAPKMRAGRVSMARRRLRAGWAPKAFAATIRSTDSRVEMWG